jgi:CDP-diglyceride synthetase
MLVSGKALLLILVANSAPILIRQVPLLEKFSYPLDSKIKFFDGRRLLGDAKTWRGIVAAILATMVCSMVLQTGWITGLIVGMLAMLGDALSSFVKRRLAMAPSDMAIGIDQIPESLLPLIYLHYNWQLGWQYVWLLMLIFMGLELVLSRILYRLHIRNRPY